MNGSYVEKTVTIKLSYRLFATVLQSIGLDILLYQQFLLLLLQRTIISILVGIKLGCFFQTVTKLI